MKIYFTRHGQVCPKDFVGSVDFPTGDIPLSELGKKQATCLGMELKRLGFKGKILASPYRRTMMTATIVAKECGVYVYPESELREMIFSNEDGEAFVGMSIENHREEFECISPDAVLKYPWWTKTKDDNEIILKRLEKLWDKLIDEKEELLLVCHGASVFGTVGYLNSRYLPQDNEELAYYFENGDKNLNCSLSCIEIDNGKCVSVKFFDTSHLSDDMLTSNTNFKERPYVLNLCGEKLR